LIFSFGLNQKKQKFKTENSIRVKATATNLCRDPGRQGMFRVVVFILINSCALPSGSLHRPSHTVHCLVLQRKEFKVEKESPWLVDLILSNEGCCFSEMPVDFLRVDQPKQREV
jgi:hypothetical protein